MLFQPSDTISITPRIVYQKLETDGYPRIDVYNILGNPYTTTQPPVNPGERGQVTQFREGIDDELTLADLKMEFGLGGVTLTSVSSYTDRDLTVLRDASSADRQRHFVIERHHRHRDPGGRALEFAAVRCDFAQIVQSGSAARFRRRRRVRMVGRRVLSGHRSRLRPEPADAGLRCLARALGSADQRRLQCAARHALLLECAV